MAWYPTNSAKKLTSPPRIMGSVVDAAKSHYFSAFTLLLATWLPVLLLHSTALSVYIALWYTMRCITQTMRSKYEVRCLSASIIIDSSTFRLSSRCHLKYLQLCLHCTLFGSALLCPALGMYEHSNCMIDGWYGWMVGQTCSLSIPRRWQHSARFLHDIIANVMW